MIWSRRSASIDANVRGKLFKLVNRHVQLNAGICLKIFCKQFLNCVATFDLRTVLIDVVDVLGIEVSKSLGIAFVVGRHVPLGTVLGSRELR